MVGAIVAATSNSSGIDLLRGRHLFEADSILVHLVRYDFSSFRRCLHTIVMVVGSRVSGMRFCDDSTTVKSRVLTCVTN